MRWALKRAIFNSGLTQQQICNRLFDRGIFLKEYTFSRIVTGHTDNVADEVKAAIADVVCDGADIGELFLIHK